MVILVATAVLVAVYVGISVFGEGSDINNGRPKNLIFVISDGYGPASATYAREMGLFNYLDPKPLLPLDKYLVGHARTYSANYVITDSAAGATAYSCGLRTDNNEVAIRPAPDNTACATFLEAAKQTKYTV